MSEGAESERAVVTSFLRTGLHDNNTGLVLNFHPQIVTIFCVTCIKKNKHAVFGPTCTVDFRCILTFHIACTGN